VNNYLQMTSIGIRRCLLDQQPERKGFNVEHDKTEVFGIIWTSHNRTLTEKEKTSLKAGTIVDRLLIVLLTTQSCYRHKLKHKHSFVQVLALYIF